MDSPQTAWKRNHENVAQFQQQQQQQQQQQRGIKMGTASLSKSTAAAAVPLPPKQHKQQQHQQQQQQQKPVPSVRKQTPPSPMRDSSHPVQLPPKTKIRQKVREEQLQQQLQQQQQQQLNYDSTDVYDEQTEDEMIEASVTDADEVGGYFRNLAMIR